VADAEIDEWRGVFETCDADRDGALSAKEVGERLAARGVPADVDPQSLVSFLDANWSGSVEFAEFAKGAHDLRAAGCDLAKLLADQDAATPSTADIKALRKAIGGLLSPSGSSSMLLTRRGGPATPEKAGTGAGGGEEERLREEVDKLSVSKKVVEDQLEAAQAQIAALGVEREALKKQMLGSNMEAKAAVESARQAEQQMKEFGEQVV
jgi:hypothetical protein